MAHLRDDSLDDDTEEDAEYVKASMRGHKFRKEQVRRYYSSG